MSDPTIVVHPATKINDNEWTADAEIQFPNGDVDRGASGVRAPTKQEAERVAGQKAKDRLRSIEKKTLNITHPKKT